MLNRKDSVNRHDHLILAENKRELHDISARSSTNPPKQFPTLICVHIRRRNLAPIENPKGHEFSQKP